jgi:hypothetical protein
MPIKCSLQTKKIHTPPLSRDEVKIKTGAHNKMFPADHNKMYTYYHCKKMR